VDLIRRFAEQQYAAALESWQWIGLDGKTPLFTSAFGDVFFRVADGIWWLDTLEGALTRRWQALGDLQAELNTAEGQDQYLLAGLAHSAGQAGLVPGTGQILSFRHPPALGGQLDISNVEVSDFVVAVNIAGQIRDQIRNLPPGTKITGVTIDGPPVLSASMPRSSP
jgi:hypothetical protein